LRFCSTPRTAACLLASLITSMASTTSHAQVAYDQIEVGTILFPSGIALGLFTKPIPLPPGQWEVVSKQEDALALSGGRSDAPGSTPRISLTLRNLDRQENPIFALALQFTPNSLAINWRNQPCTAERPSSLLDDFGVNASAMLYACAFGDTAYNFRKTVTDSPSSSNPFVQSTLAGLVPYASDVPNNAVLVDIQGNKFRGKFMRIIYMLQAEANPDLNPTYRSHLKTWMHDTGTRWMKVLDNESTALPGPGVFKTGL
jgi:hypothetical protein